MRFHESDDGENWDYIRWQGAKKQAFNSRYGKERLREVEAALLALPTKTLVWGHLVTPYEPATGWAPLFEWGSTNYPSGIEPGECCLVGAYCAYKLGDGDMAVGMKKLLDRRLPDWEYSEGSETADEGVNQGMRYTMAWELGFLNDDTLRSCTPAERYDRALARVRTLLERGVEDAPWARV